MSDNVAIN